MLIDHGDGQSSSGSATDLKARLLADTIGRLRRRKANRPLQRILSKAHPVDLANALRLVADEEITPVFFTVEDMELQSEVLSYVHPTTRSLIISQSRLERLLPIFEQMAPDDMTDLLGNLDNELADKILERMASDSKEEIEDLMRYAPDTAGGIMTPDVFALDEESTVKEAIKAIHKLADVEMVFYLYVVDKKERLQGVVSLRELLLAPPETLLGDIMNPRVIRVDTHTDQGKVAELARKYEILAIPVVDETNVLVGMVTVDDIFDVIQAETTEDMLRMAGTSEAEILATSSFNIARIRLPWLFAAFLGGLAATAIIRYFEPVMAKFLALSAFLPIIMGMAGNVGVQSATVAVRGLATGGLDVRDTSAVLLKELRVGALLGVFYGIVLAVFGWWMFNSFDLGQIVGLTILTNMTGAAVLAVMLPILFHRMNVDPAIATGPFVTTAIDILGVGNYLLIASLIFGIV